MQYLIVKYDLYHPMSYLRSVSLEKTRGNSCIISNWKLNYTKVISKFFLSFYQSISVFLWDFLPSQVSLTRQIDCSWPFSLIGHGIMAINFFHLPRSLAFDASSSIVVWGGASISMFPGSPRFCCSWTAWYVILSGPDRKVSSSHLSLRLRIALIRLYEQVIGRASCGIVLPVRRDSMRLFAPLSCHITGGVILQVSHPYVRMDHMAAM